MGGRRFAFATTGAAPASRARRRAAGCSSGGRRFTFATTGAAPASWARRRAAECSSGCSTAGAWWLARTWRGRADPRRARCALMSWASARGLGRRCKKSLAPLAQGRRPAAAVGQLVVKLREYFRQLRHQLVAMHVAPLLATFSLVAEGSCSCGEACGGGDRFEHFCGNAASRVARARCYPLFICDQRGFADWRPRLAPPAVGVVVVRPRAQPSGVAQPREVIQLVTVARKKSKSG